MMGVWELYQGRWASSTLFRDVKAFRCSTAFLPYVLYSYAGVELVILRALDRVPWDSDGIVLMILLPIR